VVFLGFHMEIWGHSGSLGYGGLHMQHLGHALVAISNREAEFQEIVSYFVKVARNKAEAVLRRGRWVS